MGKREEFGCSFSNGLAQTSFTCGLQHWGTQKDLSDHAQVCHSDLSHLPKESVLCIYCKEQLWAYTIKFMTKELRDSKREMEPQTNGAASSVKGKNSVNGAIYEPK